MVTLAYCSQLIPLRFTQSTLFAFRSGETCHELEEVRHSGDTIAVDIWHRMALDGWFHAAKENDECYKEAFYRAEMDNIECLYGTKTTIEQKSHELQKNFMPFGHPPSNVLESDGPMPREDWCLLCRTTLRLSFEPKFHMKGRRDFSIKHRRYNATLC